MPSWWMPDSWAKALAPTIALLGWTLKPVMAETRREARVIISVLMPVTKGRVSRRVRRAMTISSMAALPARSPMPLTVHSTWRAPALTAASELATARPRSLWQWTEMIALSMLGTRFISMAIRAWNSSGTV
jgi:hypothetical protein